MNKALRFTLLITFLAYAKIANAVIGCSLNNPDADIARFFPAMTSYRVHYLSFQKQNPQGLFALEKGLKTPLDPIFETEEIPYSLYVVETNGEPIGYVFGANNRGAHSSIQLITVLNRDFKLQEIYIQRIRSPEAMAFRDSGFLNALSQIPLENFKGFSDCYRDKKCDSIPIKDPSEGRSQADFLAILRGLAKLDLLREHLLQLGTTPSPASRDARAEWISNYRGPELSLGKTLTLEQQTTPPKHWSSDKPVFVWAQEKKALVWPLDLLQKHPILVVEHEGETLTLLKATRNGNPTILRSTNPTHFKPTLDLLFEDQIFMDLTSGSQWSMSLGKSVYGPRAGEGLNRESGGVHLTWGQAQNTGVALVPLTHSKRIPEKQKPAPPLLVVSTSTEHPAFFIPKLSKKKLLVQDELIVARIENDATAWRLVDTQNQRHSFRRKDGFSMTDSATGSTWSLITGHAVEGSLAGRQLQGVVQLRLQESHWRSLFPGEKLHAGAQ